jgi:hypothetical protein
MYGLGAISGLSEVGGVRGAQVLLAPVVALRMGISLIAVPEAARVLKRWPGRLQAFCLLLGGTQATACVLWGAALLLIPPEVGEDLLGSIWPLASTLIVPTTIAVAAGALFDGAFVGLRALGASRRSMPVRLARAAAWAIGGIVGALLGDAKGSVWGTAAANLLAVVLVWWQLGVGARANVAGAPNSSDAPAGHLQ